MGLQTLLTGNALEAHSALDEQASNSHPALSDALLAKFDNKTNHNLGEIYTHELKVKM